MQGVVLEHHQIPAEQWLLLGFAMYAVMRFALRYVIDRRKRMKDIGSREFQISYQKLREPVRVVAMSGAASRVIGHFYPGDLPPDQGEQKSLFDEIEEPEVPSGGPD